MAIQPVEQGSAFAFRNVINNNFYELKVLSGASKPTQSTAAVVGQMYLDTSEGKMYFCSRVSGSVYTWKPFSEFSGSYNDLEDKPSLFSGNYNDLTNKPDSSKISYNNNLSSLEADNVQNAIDEIISLKAAKNGFATLDSSGKVPSTQLPSMNYIPNSQKGVANGVATLDSSRKLSKSQIPYSVNKGSIPDNEYVINATYVLAQLGGLLYLSINGTLIKPSMSTNRRSLSLESLNISHVVTNSESSDIAGSLYSFNPVNNPMDSIQYETTCGLSVFNGAIDELYLPGYEDQSPDNVEFTANFIIPIESSYI